ncbi:MAG: hypothetical protein NDI61_01310 [Bdellovibrionaceae bacterium]|nr:hypothetical protein [Pseudobdellovibrionaceae bacterium]
MSTEHTQLAEKLRAEATKLSKAADLLFKAAAVLDGNASAETNFKAETAETQPQLPIETKGTREDQVRELLTKQGPLRAIDVIRAGIPRGTATTILSEKKGFRKTEDGRWFYPGN